MRQYKVCLIQGCNIRKGIKNIRIEYEDGLLRGGLCPIHAKPVDELKRRAGHHFFRVRDALKNRRHLATKLEIHTMEDIEELKREAAQGDGVSSSPLA